MNFLVIKTERFLIKTETFQPWINLLITIFIPYFASKVAATAEYYHNRERLKRYRIADETMLKNKIEHILTAVIMQALLFVVVFSIIVKRIICNGKPEPVNIVFVMYLIAVTSMFLSGINFIPAQQKNLSYNLRNRLKYVLIFFACQFVCIVMPLLSYGLLTYKINFDKDVPYLWLFIGSCLPVAAGFVYVFGGKEKEQNKRDYEIITDDKQQKYAVVFSDGCDSSTVIQRAVIKNAAEGDAEDIKTSAVLEIDITSYQKLDSIKVSYRELRHFDKVTLLPDEETKRETIAAKIHRLYDNLRQRWYNKRVAANKEPVSVTEENKTEKD